MKNEYIRPPFSHEKINADEWRTYDKYVKKCYCRNIILKTILVQFRQLSFILEKDVFFSLKLTKSSGLEEIKVNCKLVTMQL